MIRDLSLLKMDIILEMKNRQDLASVGHTVKSLTTQGYESIMAFGWFQVKQASMTGD